MTRNISFLKFVLPLISTRDLSIGYFRENIKYCTFVIPNNNNLKKRNRIERYDFWLRFLLLILLFFFPLFFRREKNNQSRGQKSCLSARLRRRLPLKNTMLLRTVTFFSVIKFSLQQLLVKIEWITKKTYLKPVLLIHHPFLLPSFLDERKRVKNNQLSYIYWSNRFSPNYKL